MGQSVVALMWGIREDKATRKLLVGPSKEDYFWDDSKRPKEKQLAYKEPRRPRSAYEGEVLGFAVASSSGHDQDEGDLADTASIEDIEKTHAKYINAAMQRWEAFAAWVKEVHSKELPAPRLWLTRDERA